MTQPTITPAQVDKRRGHKLFTEQIAQKLASNGQASAQDPENQPDHTPVVKIFGGSATWVLTESDPQNSDILWGLCDLGMGCPEYGPVSRRELETITYSGLNLALERDHYWTPKHPISKYIETAIRHGAIREPAADPSEGVANV